jgi:hypothetical protein
MCTAASRLKCSKCAELLPHVRRGLQCVSTATHCACSGFDCYRSVLPHVSKDLLPPVPAGHNQGLQRRCFAGTAVAVAPADTCHVCYVCQCPHVPAGNHQDLQRGCLALSQPQCRCCWARPGRSPGLVPTRQALPVACPTGPCHLQHTPTEALRVQVCWGSANPTTSISKPMPHMYGMVHMWHSGCELARSGVLFKHKSTLTGGDHSVSAPGWFCGTSHSGVQLQ